MRLATIMMQVQRQIQAKKAMASASLSSSQYRPPPGSHRMVGASTEVAASLCVSWCLLALQSAGMWAGRPQLSPRQARPRPTSGNEVRGQPHPTHRPLPPWALHPMAPPSRWRTLLSPRAPSGTLSMPAARGGRPHDVERAGHDDVAGLPEPGPVPGALRQERDLGWVRPSSSFPASTPSHPVDAYHL